MPYVVGLALACIPIYGKVHVQVWNMCVTVHGLRNLKITCMLAHVAWGKHCSWVITEKLNILTSNSCCALFTH